MVSHPHPHFTLEVLMCREDQIVSARRRELILECYTLKCATLKLFAGRFRCRCKIALALRRIMRFL